MAAEAGFVSKLCAGIPATVLQPSTLHGHALLRSGHDSVHRLRRFQSKQHVQAVCASTQATFAQDVHAEQAKGHHRRHRQEVHPDHQWACKAEVLEI